MSTDAGSSKLWFCWLQNAACHPQTCSRPPLRHVALDAQRPMAMCCTVWMHHVHALSGTWTAYNVLGLHDLISCTDSDTCLWHTSAYWGTWLDLLQVLLQEQSFEKQVFLTCCEPDSAGLHFFLESHPRLNIIPPTTTFVQCSWSQVG